MDDPEEVPAPSVSIQPTLSAVAGLLSELPLEKEQLDEVYDAVSSSSGNGYDEEYTMGNLFSLPGSGVGDDRLPASRGTGDRAYQKPLCDLIREHLMSRPQSRTASWAGQQGRDPGDTGTMSEEEVLAYVKELAASDIQIYWPSCESWDGESYPVITFDPEDGSSANTGYRIYETEDGERHVSLVIVDEEFSRNHPVWVVNRNSDDAYLSLEMMRKLHPGWTEEGGEIILKPRGDREAMAGPSSGVRNGWGLKTLVLKDFVMKRNYDSWFSGASEFFVKCGSVENFTASTEAELQLYSPQITDFMIVVKRSQVGEVQPFNAVLVSDWTDQMDNCAFMIVEDDGGYRTSWKCKALVRIESKGYGFEVELPFRSRDDVVWRGTLSKRYLMANSNIVGHFGDIDITFEVQDR